MRDKTWIILDDEVLILDIMGAMCDIWGVGMIRLNNGFTAMDWIEAFCNGTYEGPLPELALLDIRMPGPQGYEVASQLRKVAKLNNMAIVLMTAYRLSSEQREEYMEISQADHLISKPLPPMPDLNQLLLDAVDTRQWSSLHDSLLTRSYL